MRRTSIMRFELGVLSCSQSVESAADRARQNSISASGPLPTGCFASCISSADWMAGVQSTSAASSCMTISSSVAAAPTSSIVICGMLRRMSPVTCWIACEICEPNFCVFPTNSELASASAPPPISAVFAPAEGMARRGR